MQDDWASPSTNPSQEGVCPNQNTYDKHMQDGKNRNGIEENLDTGGALISLLCKQKERYHDTKYPLSSPKPTNQVQGYRKSKNSDVITPTNKKEKLKSDREFRRLKKNLNTRENVTSKQSEADYEKYFTETLKAQGLNQLDIDQLIEDQKADQIDIELQQSQLELEEMLKAEQEDLEMQLKDLQIA